MLVSCAGRGTACLTCMTAENEKRRINDPSFFVFTPSKRTDFYPKKRHAGNPAFFCFFASFDGAKIIKAQKRLHAPLCRLPKNSKNDGPWRRRFWLFFFKKPAFNHSEH